MPIQGRNKETNEWWVRNDGASHNADGQSDAEIEREMPHKLLLASTDKSAGNSNKWRQIKQSNSGPVTKEGSWGRRNFSARPTETTRMLVLLAYLVAKGMKIPGRRLRTPNDSA